MIPPTIQRQLSRLRRRERLLRLAWVGARGLILLAVVLALACGADWLIDRQRDTPRELRVGMLAGQAVLWLGVLLAVVRVIGRRISDTETALWIEAGRPALGHRLISAVQLNQPGADTRGMSPELIAAVTRQAEEEAARESFAWVADHRRLRWSAYLVAPPLLVMAVLVLLCPQTLRALLARQLLDDRPIPRTYTLAGTRPDAVWAAGEENVLYFHVQGPVEPGQQGEAVLEWGQGRRERHRLVYDSPAGRGAALFAVHVPPGGEDFTCQAWLADGRSREPVRVHYEPRPVVEDQVAWVRLPASCGLCGNGQPYEELQQGGDVVFRVPGSEARVRVRTQKPVVRATVELLGPRHPLAVADGPGMTESVRRCVALEGEPDGMHAEGRFSFQLGVRPEFLAALAGAPGAGCPQGLPWAALVLSRHGELLPAETGYRVVVEDAFGLASREPARRGIRTAPIPPPVVTLLPETFWRPGDAGTPEEQEVEQMPLLLGQRVPLSYRCSAPYGLSHAQLRYRVLRRGATVPEDEEANRERDFLPLPLGTPVGTSGARSKKAQEEFSTLPPRRPEQLAGTEGGGHYDFDSSGIPDGKGGRVRLQEGDRVQLYIEVFGRADPNAPPSRSALREKEVVNQKDFLAWALREDEKERLRQLEARQRKLGGEPPRPQPPRVPPTQPAPQPADPPAPPVPEEPHISAAPVLGRSWLLLGPFANDRGAGHAQVFPPEREPVSLGREYEGLVGKVRWQAHAGREDRVDLEKFFHHNEAGVAYAVCWIHSPQRRAMLATGSDDGIKVWIDRKVVLDRAVHREAVPRDDLTPIDLGAGWHEVLVKVDNRFGTWAFYLELEDARTGKPLRGLQVRTAPPVVRRQVPHLWLVVGPFAADLGLDRAQAPESQAIRPGSSFEGRKGRVAWRSWATLADEVEFRRAFPRDLDPAAAVGYAACWVHSKTDQPVVLNTTTDAGMKVWLNREVVIDRLGGREVGGGQDRTPVSLRGGWNEVLVKWTNRLGGGTFSLDLRDPLTDAPIPGLRMVNRPQVGQ